MTKTEWVDAFRTNAVVDLSQYDEILLWRWLREAMSEHESSFIISDDGTGLSSISLVHQKPILLLAQIQLCLARAAAAADLPSVSGADGSISFDSVAKNNLLLLTSLREQYEESCAANELGNSQILVGDLTKKDHITGLDYAYPRVDTIASPVLTLISYSSVTLEMKVSWTAYTQGNFREYRVLYNATADSFEDLSQPSRDNLDENVVNVGVVYDPRQHGATLTDVALNSYVCVTVSDIAGRRSFSNSVQAT